MLRLPALFVYPFILFSLPFPRRGERHEPPSRTENTRCWGGVSQLQYRYNDTDCCTCAVVLRQLRAIQETSRTLFRSSSKAEMVEAEEAAPPTPDPMPRSPSSPPPSSPCAMCWRCCCGGYGPTIRLSNVLTAGKMQRDFLLHQGAQ